MNSQNTKAIGGSNCRSFGASRFHPNQRTVQIKTIRKKPMVPTRLVIERATLSSALNFSEASLLTFRSGFRYFRRLLLLLWSSILMIDPELTDRLPRSRSDQLRRCEEGL